MQYLLLARCRFFPLAVLGQCRNSTEPKKLPTSEKEQIYARDTCAAVYEERLATLQKFFKDVSIL